MSGHRADGRRRESRSFRPDIDGQALESRRLLTGVAQYIPSRLAHFEFQTAASGMRLRVIKPDGEEYDVVVSGIGTVRGAATRSGSVNLTVAGTTQDTELFINPVARARYVGLAHTFANGAAGRNNLLQIGSINVTSGTIGDILGYRSATLAGPITVSSSNRVQRIAFEEILPGGSINVGGDLNTLDVLNGANFSGAGNNLVTGRDLNSFSVGGNLTVQNGAVVRVGRDLGFSPQGAQGTGPAGQGLAVSGNFVISNGSSFNVTRNLDATIFVVGRGIGITPGSPAAPGTLNFGGFGAAAAVNFVGGFTA